MAASIHRSYLACLAGAPKRPEITSINYFTKSPRGEERFYCRQVAEKFDVPLVEAELDYRKADLSKVFTSNMLANPLGFFDCKGLTGYTLALAKDRGAQALFYGVGGDNVFHQAPFNTSALDYVRCHGLFGEQTLKIAMEASRYGRKSLFRTAMDVLRERIAPLSCNEYRLKEIYGGVKFPLVNPEITGAGGHEQFLHPLLIPDDRTLKGKYLHILMSALFSIEHYDHWDTDYVAEKINIYLTQPIIEACLRIPSWVMTYGGVDRGLARKAFQNDLPRNVVRRLSKSTPTEFYNDIYNHNINFVRENLVGGELVRNKILLGDKLETFLDKTDVRLGAEKFMLLGNLATEIWLRRWTERPVNKVSNLDVAV